MKYAITWLLCATISAQAAQLVPFPADANYSSLELQSRLKDSKGNIHSRYVQTFQGVPVYGYQLIEHEYAPRLQASAFPLPQWTGKWVKGISADVTSSLRKIPPEALLKHIQNEYAIQHDQNIFFKHEFVESMIYIDINQTARYALNIHFFADVHGGGQPAWPHYILDGVTGEVLQHWEGLETDQVGTGPGGNTKTGLYQYGSDYPAFDVMIETNICVMANPNVFVVDMKHERDSGTIFSYACHPEKDIFFQNSDPINGAFSPLNDAYVFSTVVMNLYQDWYNHRPVPSPLEVNVHYANNYANAFWDGYTVTLGDGDQYLFPLATLDVVAHEIAHGVTQYASDLIYTGQSGGLNESFSDMAAKATEYYYHGKVEDWMIGADVFKAPGEALRYMDNPPQDGSSIDRAQDFTLFMDPHQSSGVFNKAFYLLATAPGWDVRKAFDVMYAANLYYWEPWSGFDSAGYGAVVAAAFLEYPYQDVIAALKAVGVSCDPITCVVD